VTLVGRVDRAWDFGVAWNTGEDDAVDVAGRALIRAHVERVPDDRGDVRARALRLYDLLRPELDARIARESPEERRANRRGGSP
jgi:hypothetical protein